MTNSVVVLRKAGLDDVDGIARLVASFAGRGQLLPRSAQAIRETLDDWVIAADGDCVLACGSLLFYSSALAEVRSLAVAREAQGMGLGSSLVAALIDEARRRGVATLFALTRAVPFFERSGFSVADRAQFPEKIWRDCVMCPVRHNCDEVTVVLKLADSNRDLGSIFRFNSPQRARRTPRRS